LKNCKKGRNMSFYKDLIDIELEKIDNFTPSKIVEELDKYIIGQDKAKKSVAIALRNRWRRQKVDYKIKDEIYPNNILMIGPTGVGKTEIARRMAKITGAPFIKVEASKFTEVGYVGKDAESMIRELVDISVNLVKEKLKNLHMERAVFNAEERILDILVPPKPLVNAPMSEIDSYTNTREKFRLKIINSELDDKEIEIETSQSGSSFMGGMQVIGPIGLDELGSNFQDILDGIIPKKSKKRKVKIKEARDIFIAEELDKLIDKDSVNKLAIKLVETAGIVFIDEIDKIANSANTRANGIDVSREGVQRDLLPIVEGTTVQTKYGTVKTDYILFIAAGAFHVAKPSDLIPELQGRFPIRVELNSLTEEDFYKILTQPQNALLKQYQALLKTEGIDLSFDDEAIKEIARVSTVVNEQVENIGARRLHTILSTILEDYLFNAPNKLKKKKIKITKEEVESKLSGIVKNKDLSKYIL